MKRIAPLLIALTFGSVPAFAQSKPPESAEVTEARQRFARGVDLYKEGSFDAALAEFTKAYELVPNYRVLFNLAQVQNERHDYVAALQFFEKYLQDGGSDISPERRELVGREITALKGRVAQVTVAADVEGAELLIDGVPAGTLPLKEPVLVSSGVRQIQVRKAGYETSTRTETIAGGDAPHYEFTLQAVPGVAAAPVGGAAKAAAEMPGLPPEPEKSSSNVPFWITLASTAAFTGGAITFGVLTHNADKKLDQALNTFPTDPNRVEDARSTLKQNALLTDIFTGAAVVSGGFCVYFAISGAHSSSGDSQKTSLRVAPAGTGVRVLGNF